METAANVTNDVSSLAQHIMNAKIRVHEENTVETEILTKNRNTLTTNKRINKVANNSVIKSKIEQIPDDAIRFSHVFHIPEVDNNRNATRCKNFPCQKKTHTKCSTCNVHLCLMSNRNCYKQFHLKKIA